MPYTLAASAPVHRFAAGDGAVQGFFVHVSMHKHVARIRIRGHNRYQPIVTKFGGKLVAFFNLLDADTRGKFCLTVRVVRLGGAHMRIPACCFMKMSLSPTTKYADGFA